MVAFLFLNIFYKQYCQYMEKKLFITYREAPFNYKTKTYDPIDPIILQDPRVSDSIIFDTNRRTIYAQGYEFGNSLTFAYMDKGTGLVGNDISKRTTYYITGITQNIDGSITYSYSYSYTTHNTSKTYIETIPNGDDGTYLLTGVGIDNNGDLSYTYTKLIINQAAQAGTLTYLENENVTGTTKDHHSYLVTWMYKNPNEDDKVTFTYTDISVNSGTVDTQRGKGSANATILNNTAYRFITNVSQAGDGKISYTYADFRTTHSTKTGDNLSPELENTQSVHEQLPGEQIGRTNYDTGGVITGVNLSAAGNLSYCYKNLKAIGTYQNKYTINNKESDSPEFIYDLIQYRDGSISYKTHKINTEIGHVSDNVVGVVYEVNVDDRGQTISYAHKNLTTNSGTSKGTKKLHNGSTYNFITSVSQDAYGKLSYEYITLQNSFDNNGSTNGVITNVHIDNTGKLSYDSVNLKNDSGTLIRFRDVSNSDNFEVMPDSENSTGVNLITGISQAPNGKISYTYSSLCTDRKNYNYHDLKLKLDSRTDSIVKDGNVKVIKKLDIDIQGNNTSHIISYTYTQVPTREYVDALITANDAMRYCGTFRGDGAAAIGTGYSQLLLISGDGRNHPDTSCGAVYKCSIACKIQGHTFSVGDWIMSNKDDASTTDITDGWDTFNVNITVNSVGDKAPNTNEGTAVLTNVYADDTGTLSYTYAPLVASNTPSNILTSKTSENNKSENILLNETNPKGFRVITDVNLSQNNLSTKLSYTYTYLYVNQKHHGTNTYTATQNATLDTNYVYVVTGVSLGNDGTLSYCVTPYNVSDSSHAGSAIGLDAIVKVGANSGAITNLYVDTNDDNKLTYVITDNSSSVEQTNGFIYKVVQDTYGKATVTGRNFSTLGTEKTTAQNYVVTYVYMGSDGQLHYNYRDISGSTGSKHTDTTITNSTKLNVVTGISQTKDGKVSYVYDALNTTHTNTGTSTAGASKVIGAVNLDANGNFTYSYVDIANAAYHYAVATSYSTDSKTITIPVNGTNTVDFLAYNQATTNNGHLTGLTKTTYAIKHGAANTSGSVIAKKTLIIPLNGTNVSNEFVSYKSITTDNGHVTSYIRTSYVLQHEKIQETQSIGDSTFDPEGTRVISGITRINGHIAGVGTTNITDVNVKFIQDITNSVYIGGSKNAGNETIITNAYIDGVSYINNGTLYETNIQVGTDLSVGRNVSVGSDVLVGSDMSVGSDLYVVNSANIKGDADIKGDVTIGGDTAIGGDSGNTVILNAAKVTLPSSTTKIEFTNLQALWGTL